MLSYSYNTLNFSPLSSEEINFSCKIMWVSVYPTQAGVAGSVSSVQPEPQWGGACYSSLWARERLGRRQGWTIRHATPGWGQLWDCHGICHSLIPSCPGPPGSSVQVLLPSQALFSAAVVFLISLHTLT